MRVRSGVAALCLAIVGCTSTTVSTTITSGPPTTSTTSVPTTSSTGPTPTTTTLPADRQPIDVGPLAARGGHTVVWTGEEVIVWGGQANETAGTVFGDGAAYDPETSSWRMLSQSPLEARWGHVAAWTGEEMVIVGGFVGDDGAAYSPANDTWRVIAPPPFRVASPAEIVEGFIGSAWTGDELVVWHVHHGYLAAYDPEADSWRELPPTGLDVDNGVLRWTGDELYAFGATVNDFPATNDLEARRLEGDSWKVLPSASFSTEEYTLGADARLTAWAGDRFLAWSDQSAEGRTMAFDPATDTWAETQKVISRSCEGNGEPISGEGVVFAFGWCGPGVEMFDVATQTWTQAETGGYPTLRHTVWTGAELINWGDTCCYGTGGSPFTVEAWRYVPEG